MIDMELVSRGLKNPLLLLMFKDQELEYANNLLPYSIGFEIECHKGKEYKEQYFKEIPNIMSIDVDNSEQRYRIPNGIAGIICLYHISRQLCYNSELNPGSGIHYHVDCTDSFDTITTELSLEDAQGILRDLDSWDYKGKYNGRGYSFSGNPNRLPYGNWVRSQAGFKTWEFRIGEMTFDYNLLLKRMMHLCQIMKRVKDSFNIKPPTFIHPEYKVILDYERKIVDSTNPAQKLMQQLNERIAKLQEEKDEEIRMNDPLSEIRPQLRNRLHKIKKNG